MLVILERISNRMFYSKTGSHTKDVEYAAVFKLTIQNGSDAIVSDPAMPAGLGGKYKLRALMVEAGK